MLNGSTPLVIVSGFSIRITDKPSEAKQRAYRCYEKRYFPLQTPASAQSKPQAASTGAKEESEGRERRGIYETKDRCGEVSPNGYKYERC